MKQTVKIIDDPHNEAQHQTNVMRWSLINMDKFPELSLLHHIPNGGTRDAIEGKHLKDQGVKSGVPDLCLPVPKGKYHGLYIEMKTEKGHETNEQSWWRERLTLEGYLVLVCHGWLNAVDTIEHYMYLGPFHI